MRRCGLLHLAAVAAAAALPAQERFWIDDPVHLTDPNQGNNMIPFGCTNGTGPLNDSRWQQLVPARVLPPLRCRLEAMSVMTNMAAGEQRYEKLQIDVAATRAETLELDLQANLQVPMTVLRREEHALRWIANEITRVPFDAAFPHDGSSGLVFDIHKVVDPANVTGMLNSRTTNSRGGDEAKPTVFAALATEPERRTVNRHPCQLLVRLHFVARERFGARVVAGDLPARAGAAVPWRRRARGGGTTDARLPASGRYLEVGAVGAAGAWQVFRLAFATDPHGPARRRLEPDDDDAAAVVAVAIGPGGLGVVEVPLPTVREVLGIPLAARTALAGGLGGWDRPVSVRVDG